MWSPITIAAMVSNIGISTRWPRPERSRSITAARIALTAERPTMRSAAAVGM